MVTISAVGSPVSLEVGLNPPSFLGELRSALKRSDERLSSYEEDRFP